MFQVDENYTHLSEFVIVGFPSLQPEFFELVAWFFFVLYVATVVGNLLLLVVFALEHSLHKPMYITMVSLALSDIGKYSFSCHSSSTFKICATFIKEIIAPKNHYMAMICHLKHLNKH